MPPSLLPLVFLTIQSHFGESLAPDESLSVLSCDSLDLLELIIELEAQLHISLPEDSFNERMTPVEFATAISHHLSQESVA